MIHDARFKTHAAKVAGMEFILSDESIDRMGDVIKADGWDLTNFRKNPIALFGHSSGFPIGKWSNLRVENKQLRGHLELAPEGTSQRIDEIRRLVDADILRTVSVGFKPIKSEPRMDGDKYVGETFTKQELFETSLVSVPANPNAIAVARSLNVSRATLDLIFAESGNTKDQIVLRDLTGESADTRKNRSSGKGSAMPQLAQRIQDAQAEFVSLSDQLEQHLGSYDDSNATDKDLDLTTALNAKLKQKRRVLDSLQECERNLAGTASGGDGPEHRQLIIVPPKKDRDFGERRNPNPDIDDREYARRMKYFSPPGTAVKDLKPLDWAVRTAVAQLWSRATGRNPMEIGRTYAPYDNDQTRAIIDWNMRGAVNPALTTVAGWAQELVQTQYSADLLGLLMPKSIFPRLSAMGLSLSFGRAGRISVPTRAATPTIAGSFVGEGLPIPVRMGAFSSFILTPKKLAVISTWSKEIDEHSIPAMEGLVRDMIAEDTAVALDSVLIDTNAATTVRPAGIFNGVTPITATAITGGAFAAIVSDLKALTDAITVTTHGNLRNPAWLMNPSQVLSARMIVPPNTGVMPFRDELARGELLGFPVIDSGTVPLKSVGLIDAADFVTVGGEAPRFDLSDSATLHEEDTTPAPIVSGAAPGTPATPVRSLFQTDTLALRMIQRMNWMVRRPGVVALVQNVTW